GSEKTFVFGTQINKFLAFKETFNPFIAFWRARKDSGTSYDKESSRKRQAAALVIKFDATVRYTPVKKSLGLLTATLVLGRYCPGLAGSSYEELGNTKRSRLL